MATTINVKIAPLPRGEWDNGTAYAKLDAVSYNGSSYMAIKATPAGTLPTNTTYWQVLAEQPTITDGSITTNKIADGAVTLDKLGDITGLSGEYDNMTVGSAEQLLSDTYDEESVPYAFRRSPYGDRVEEEIVGGSIAWNQKCSGFAVTRSTLSSTTNGTSAVTCTATGVSSPNSFGFIPKDNNGNYNFVKDRIYRISLNVTSISIVNFAGLRAAAALNPVNTSVLMSAGTYDVICKPTANGASVILAYISTGTTPTTNDKFTFDSVQVHDLTQMFGSTVADYIYGLETNHTGDGVAFFRSLFPKAYYAYNAGTLIHSNPTSKVTTGKNLFSGALVNGQIGSNGGYSSSTSRLTNVTASNVLGDFLKVGTYTISAQAVTSATSLTQCSVLTKDSSLNIIDNFATSWHNLPFTFTLSSDGYICFTLRASTGDLTPSNYVAQIEYGSSATTYEAYSSPRTYPLSSGVLRGVSKLVNNKFKFDGDIYTSDGTIQRRYGIQDLGAIAWGYSNNGYFYSTALQGAARSDSDGQIANIVCPNFTSATANQIINAQVDKAIGLRHTEEGRIWIRDTTAGTNANTFKTSMNGVYLVYELKTPTTESASPYVNPQYCNEYGTEQFVTTEQSGVAMITGHISKYFANLRKKIEGLPWNFSSLIAPNESTNKASQNYAVGSYLIYNNTLYKVTSAIASGGTITPNTNCVATTIMAEILSL